MMRPEFFLTFSKVWHKVSYVFLGIGLFLLLALGIQAYERLTDPVMVRGRPKSVADKAEAPAIDPLRVFDANSKQTAAYIPVGTTTKKPAAPVLFAPKPARAEPVGIKSPQTAALPAKVPAEATSRSGMMRDEDSSQRRDVAEKQTAGAGQSSD